MLQVVSAEGPLKHWVQLIYMSEDDLPSNDEDYLPGDPLNRPAPDTVDDGVKPPVAPDLQPTLVSVQHCHGTPGVELRSGHHHHHPPHYIHYHN